MAGLGCARPPPSLTTDADVIAWLDTGQPDPDQAATRIRRITDAVIEAAQRTISGPITAE